MPSPGQLFGRLLLLSMLVPIVALAQPFDDLATAEFQVNTHVANDQRIPEVASDAHGNSVIIWQSRNQDAPSWGVHAQRFDAQAGALGEEFRVNVFNQGQQDGQHVRMLADGRFVVVWNGRDRDFERAVIQMRRFRADGQPEGGDRRLSNAIDDLQILPRLGLLEDGALVVGWEGRGVSGPSFNIFSRRFNANDQALQAVAQVNQFDDTAQRRVDLAVNDRGNQVIAWQSASQDGSDWGVFARCAILGTSGGAEFLVNQTTVGGQARPRVAMADDGRFAIVWQDTRGASQFNYQRVMVRLYDPACQPLTGEIQVNQFDEGVQDLPDISIDGHGVYIVVWQNYPPDFEFQGIYGRRLDSSGTFLGDEFKISQEIIAYQDYPAVEGLPDGGFMAVWETIGQDGSGFGIFARRFFGPGPARLELTGGGQQAARTGTAFAEPLQVQLLDQWGLPQAGRVLVFEASDVGPGALFADGSDVAVLITDDNGEVSVAVRANEQPGHHVVLVSVDGAGLTLPIALSNVVDGHAAVPVSLGSGPVPGVLIFLILFLAWQRRALLIST
jgi:hypothetical protein